MFNYNVIRLDCTKSKLMSQVTTKYYIRNTWEPQHALLFIVKLSICIKYKFFFQYFKLSPLFKQCKESQKEM